MKWKEFAQLLKGLSGETPIGRIVAVRSETDPEVLKRFSKDQRRIRNEWLRRKAKKMPKKESEAFIESMKQAFLNMAK